MSLLGFLPPTGDVPITVRSWKWPQAHSLSSHGVKNIKKRGDKSKLSQRNRDHNPSELGVLFPDSRPAFPTDLGAVGGSRRGRDISGDISGDKGQPALNKVPIIPGQEEGGRQGRRSTRP